MHGITRAECEPVANGVANGQMGHEECWRPESEQRASTSRPTSRPHPQTGVGIRFSDARTSTPMSTESMSKQCSLKNSVAANAPANISSPSKTIFQKISGGTIGRDLKL